MASITNVNELQALLDICLSVRDWETLPESNQIPEAILPLAYARLTELNLKELQVNKRFDFTSVLSCSAELNFTYIRRRMMNKLAHLTKCWTNILSTKHLEVWLKILCLSFDF